MLGMCLPDARIHSPNENFSVELFTKGIEMSQILLRRLGRSNGNPPSYGPACRR